MSAQRGLAKRRLASTYFQHGHQLGRAELLHLIAAHEASVPRAVLGLGDTFWADPVAYVSRACHLP